MKDLNGWEGAMQKHAKSFYFASLFFPPSMLPGVKALYALCRFVDDTADNTKDDQSAHEVLQLVADDLHSTQPKIGFNAFYRLLNLDVGYIDDLIEGAKDDLDKMRIQDQPHLIQYCYKVAGTVGLAMFDLMEVKIPQARSNAVDLGIAMQITNICRDVKEDLERDRIYLPKNLLAKYNLSESDLRSEKINQESLKSVIEEMLTLADRYYESANSALGSIPCRTRGAIIIASHLYRGIGVKLLKAGGNPMHGRTYLTKRERNWVATKGLFVWLISPLTRRKPINNPELHKGLEVWRKLREFDL